MFCAADQSTPEIQAATIHWEHTGRRTAFWKRIKPNRANKSLNIWPHAGLPGGYVRSSGSEVSYLPLFSLENSASKFALLTGQDQISDTRIGGLLHRFECLGFFFYLNGRGFLLPGNLENDCICLKKKKKKQQSQKDVRCGWWCVAVSLLECRCARAGLGCCTVMRGRLPTSALLTRMGEWVGESPVPMGQDGAQETGGPAEEAGSHDGQPSSKPCFSFSCCS